MARKRKTVNRRSIFDPYIDLITECVGAGMTYQQIADVLEERTGMEVCRDTVYYFCKVRGVKSRVTQGGHNSNEVPLCRECSECQYITDFSGRHQVRVCGAIKRIIESNVAYSPQFCPKRQVSRLTANEKYNEVLGNE